MSYQIRDVQHALGTEYLLLTTYLLLNVLVRKYQGVVCLHSAHQNTCEVVYSLVNAWKNIYNSHKKLYFVYFLSIYTYIYTCININV